MKKMLFSIILIYNISFSQVGIGTETPNTSSLLEINASDKTFVPPRMTNSQMLAITTPLISSIVFNTNRNSLFIYTSLGWKSMLETDNSILACKRNGGNLITSNNTFYNFPLNNTHVKTENILSYEVLSNGKVKVKENGIYMISAELSVNNMPSGTRGFSINIYKNGHLEGVLIKNETLQTKTEYWGTSGIMTFKFSIDDIIDIKYSINHNGSLNSVFTGFSITKIK